MKASQNFIALDVGTRRIGVARGDSAVKIAVCLDTVEVDGREVEQLKRLFKIEMPDKIIVGYPRNQSGEATAQTAWVEQFIAQFDISSDKLVYQDESLTSVLAEQQLQSSGRNYTKGDIDARAAALILEDYMEANS